MDELLDWMVRTYAGEVGPLTPEPHEVAEDWVRRATPALWALFTERLMDASTYQPLSGHPHLSEGLFSVCEELIDEEARRDPQSALERFVSLLANPIGRRAGLCAVYAAARYGGRRVGNVCTLRLQAILEEHAAHLTWMNDHERIDLCGALADLHPTWAVDFAAKIGLDCDGYLNRPLGS